jgi:two-component system sensor histidine kinase/response regulator
MSLKNRVLFFLKTDNTIFQLLLLGLLIAGPVHHYLFFDNGYDPFSLRIISSALCFMALVSSFYPSSLIYKLSVYAVIIYFIGVDNCYLLGKNNFDHIYLFGTARVYIALTLFCKRPWQFITLFALNLCAVLVAYTSATQLNITVIGLVVLLLSFAFVTYVSFLVSMSYRLKFKAAVRDIVDLNQNLIINDTRLNENRKSLHSLINSLNEIIFEFDETKTCLNVWFSTMEKRVIDPKVIINKKIAEIISDEKAQKYNDALNYVIKNRQPTSLQHISDFGTGRWMEAKFAPVYDEDNNYTFRISASLTDITEQKMYADALQEKEALLLDAQRIAKIGNWSYNHQTKESYWSANLYTILEIETIPKGIDKFEYYISLIHPEDRENAHHYFSSIRLIDNTDFEHRIITPGGKLKYIKAIKGDTGTDENGAPRESTVGVLQDISESKISEKIIKVSQAELLEAQLIAKIGNWKWDLPLNKITWSEEINHIFEVDQKVANNTNIVRLLLRYIHPADRALLKRHLKNATNIAITNREYRIVTGSGKTKYLSVIIGKIMRRDDGTPRKIIGTIQDITDRKQAEIDYKTTEDKYKLVLESIKLPAVTVDKDGVIIFCNKYMSGLLGYDQKEILGLNWFDTFIQDSSSTNYFKKINQYGFEPQNISTVICRDGELRTVSWQNTISYDDYDNIKEVTGIGEDITEREKATAALINAKEEAEKSSKFKSEFLSIMSHEIRTPMNAVIGTTNLLLTEDPKPDQLEYLNTLKFSGENLLAIINDILDYNKIEAGKLELNKLSFNLHNLAKKIKQSFFSKASEKGINIELLIDDTIPEYLIGDQIRLGQVLNNLLSNAVKFTHAGKVTLKLEYEVLNDKQVTIKFTVADTGIGMATSNLNIIFEPFVQETQTNGNDYGGTGLGLAITKRLIDLHQSDINVTSIPGKGTQFIFTIVFDIAEQPLKTDTLQPQDSLAGGNSLKGMRVLVVDDNKMNLLIASKFLKKWDAEPEEAISGQQAIDMVKNNYYDLIIMDLQMPGMNGFEATGIIKMTHPHMPIIALTADAMPETHSKAFAAGMCDYLTKPFVPETLFGKVAKYYTPLELVPVKVEI